MIRLIASYFFAYFSLLQPVGIINENPPGHIDGYEVHYRSGGLGSHIVFLPAHIIDRTLNPRDFTGPYFDPRAVLAYEADVRLEKQRMKRVLQLMKDRAERLLARISRFPPSKRAAELRRILDDESEWYDALRQAGQCCDH